MRQAGRELREAAAFILGSTWLLTTIVIPAFGNAAFGGAMLVTLPRLVSDVYGAGVWLLGAIVANGMLRKPLSHRDFCRLASGESDPEYERKMMNGAVWRG